jgi:G3E family GTPase
MTQILPVTLLTGFLGSGKTTLLNALLRHPDMGRTAVVMNEFGEIALDHDLIEAATEAMVLMQSGCLCCTVRGDLVETLNDLHKRRAKGDIAFDRVVIETTGIADPAPIIHTLVMEPELSRRFALDGVVVTADCATGARALDDTFEAQQQIAMADRLVLTKTDLVLPTERAAFETRLRTLNPNAPRHVADHGTIDPALLFGVAPTETTAREAAMRWVAAPPPVALPPLSGFGLGTGASHGLFAPKPAHDGRITSQSMTLDKPVAPIVFDLWLDALMSSRGRDILRLKAVVHVEGLEHPFALHGVGQVFHPPVPLTHWPKGDTQSRIVIIGRDLPPGYLAESLAFLKSPPPMTGHRI